MSIRIPIISALDLRSRKNLIAGFSYQLISIGMGLLLPYLFITNLGSESNGLLNSVGQVFTCLGLLEAGVGTATIQALYKPIANNDQHGISSILSATHRYYLKTGMWYTVAVTILVIVYPFIFVESKLPSSTIRLVILLQGIGTIISYLCQSKYTFLLKAEGKNYIITNLSLCVLLLRNFGKIIAIRLGYDIIAIQAIHLVTVLIEALFIVTYVKKKYSWLRVDTEPDYKSISQKNSVLAQSIAWMVFNHTDILVLSVFTRDLGLISVYSVYALVFEAAQNFLNQIRGSFQFKIGNAAQKKESELDTYFTGYGYRIILITFCLFMVVYLLASPFVGLYTKGVTDAEYSIAGVSELFFTYKLLYCIRALYKQVIEANGHFQQTQSIAITETVINLIASIALVYWFQIIGVLIGTVVSLIYSVAKYMMYIHGYVARHAVRTHFRLILCCLPIFILAICLGCSDLFVINSWIDLGRYAVLFGVVALSVFGLLYKTCYRINGNRKNS